MADVTPASFRSTLRLLCAALLGSQVVVLLAVSATLGSAGFESPPAWALLAVGVVGLAEVALLPVVGYQVAPIAPGTPTDDVRRQVLGAVQTSTILRFVVAEAITIGSVALAFAVDSGGTLVCLLGVAISITLGFLHVWPGDRVLTRLREAFERDGAPSQLEAVLDGPPLRD